jgi:hypothetical protein
MRSRALVVGAKPDRRSLAGRSAPGRMGAGTGSVAVRTRPPRGPARPRGAHLDARADSPRTLMGSAQRRHRRPGQAVDQGSRGLRPRRRTARPALRPACLHPGRAEPVPADHLDPVVPWPTRPTTPTTTSPVAFDSDRNTFSQAVKRMRSGKSPSGSSRRHSAGPATADRWTIT